MNPEPDHPPPEKMRQEVELALHPPDDFTNDSPSRKYECFEEKSTKSAAETTAIDFVCIQETDPGSYPHIGVFLKISAETSAGISAHDRGPWTICPVPKSWRRARSSRLVAPSPDGCTEQPRSLVKPFNSEAEALLTFKRMTNSLC